MKKVLISLSVAVFLVACSGNSNLKLPDTFVIDTYKTVLNPNDETKVKTVEMHSVIARTDTGDIYITTYFPDGDRTIVIINTSVKITSSPEGKKYLYSGGIIGTGKATLLIGKDKENKITAFLNYENIDFSVLHTEGALAN